MSGFNYVLLLMVGLMWLSMQMTQNMIRVTHLLTVKKPAGMHCTQQTTAKLATERREGGEHKDMG